MFFENAKFNLFCYLRTAICVKRITNQNESLLLPQWTQSQISLSDINLNSDPLCSQPQSLLDYNSEFDKASVVQQLVRKDTETSHRSYSSSNDTASVIK